MPEETSLDYLIVDSSSRDQPSKNGGIKPVKNGKIVVVNGKSGKKDKDKKPIEVNYN